MNLLPPSLITFDCTGTLFEPTASIGSLYKRAIVDEAEKFGLSGVLDAKLSEDVIGNAFGTAFAVADAARPCFGAGDCTSEEWWRPVVENTILSAARESECAELDARLLPGAFDALFHKTFVSLDAWRLSRHAAETLSTLSDWRAARAPSEPTLTLGVISNWDERLPMLLTRLGVLHHFDFVVTSRELGIEKPSTRIFDHAREVAGVRAGGRCVHVGDSFQRDCIGAARAGWDPIFVCTEAKASRVSAELRASTDHVRVDCLDALPGTLLGES